MKMNDTGDLWLTSPNDLSDSPLRHARPISRTYSAHKLLASFFYLLLGGVSRPGQLHGIHSFKIANAISNL